MRLSLILLTALAAPCWSKKCNQAPPQATILEPSENKGVFKMIIETKMTSLSYMPEQTYLVSLIALKEEHPFRWFMITAEDPAVDNSTYAITSGPADVGSLKTLDTDTGKKTRYSDRCFNSVESTDYSDKYRVDIHWISPKFSDSEQVVRLRATVAENNEVWYMDDEDLIILLHKDNRPPIDSPPTEPVLYCDLCSEARYEVIFYGKWSRVSHPQYYPNKPDTNGYTHMLGASHSNDYVLWRKDQAASPGLKELVEDAVTETLEQEIISKEKGTVASVITGYADLTTVLRCNGRRVVSDSDIMFLSHYSVMGRRFAYHQMEKENGTRTLIRGKRRHHPFMFEPSHSLFRVDRYHHRFSIVVGMRPSPDWFLGTSHFELCTPNGWWKEAEIPLYPWDAGTMDGVSYESVRQVTLPTDKVKRVDVGSFNKASPFYQMNLNDLKPFAMLKVRLLDVYPQPGECSSHTSLEEGENEEEEDNEEDSQDDPRVGESKQDLNRQSCDVQAWSEWSACRPLYGDCGRGLQTRNLEKHSGNTYGDEDQDLQVLPFGTGCYGEETVTTQKRDCYVEC